MEYAVLLNPIVYMSEGLRVALTPGPPHMPSWLILGASLISLLLGWMGGHSRIPAPRHRIGGVFPDGTENAAYPGPWLYSRETPPRTRG